MRVLVTGGAGYIGSHTTVALQQGGHDVVIVDNLANARRSVVERIRSITGIAPAWYELDVGNASELHSVFSECAVDAVIHFAGWKSVEESARKPLLYYRENFSSTLTLLDAMDRHDVRTLVFSSSATVYGMTSASPLTEDLPLNPTNPYGRTKWFIEECLRDLAAADERWRIAVLRYFNPVGAHPSGLIGESPRQTPNNLMPYITQVAIGRRAELSIFGADYDTVDGTGVRDYIHVDDLANGHLAALHGVRDRAPGCETWNLGTGHGTSVLELVTTFERVTGQVVPRRIVARRPGDVATNYADTTKARSELGWQARRTLEDMCADAWRWQENNPDGLP